MHRTPAPCPLLLLSLALVLSACSPSEPAATVAKPIPPEALATGAALYEQNCAQCHYAGEGSPTAPDLMGSKLVAGNAADVITTILYGKKGPALINGREMQAIMPAQAELPDEEIAAIVSYVRHQFAQKNELTTPADVAAMR